MNEEVTKLARMNQDSLTEVLRLKRTIENALIFIAKGKCPEEILRAAVDSPRKVL